MINIDQMIERARVAQKEFEENFTTQEKVDAIVKDIGKVVYDHAEPLARLAIDETRMGVYEDKVAKNKGKSKNIWLDLKDKNSVGVIDTDEISGLITVAKPMGVVGGITPTTNPVVTPMSKSMFAVKTRNAIIIAPHPRSKQTSTDTINHIRNILKAHGAPEDLVQIIEEPSIDLTSELMQKVDVIVATGGMGMVKSAYSSGKPSYGVGAGNVQCIIDRGVDYDEAVKKAVDGRKFDNGIICSGEQSIIYPAEERDAIVSALEKANAYVIPKEEVHKLTDALFVNGMTNKDFVGMDATFIAKEVGIEVPETTKVLVVESNGGRGEEELVAKEKMCPVMGLFAYDDFEDGVAIAKANLNLEGNGHSASIHSNDPEHIQYAGQVLTVSRLVVNAVCSTTAGGAANNGLAVTNTLGCGSWGNNSISENFTYKHLLNTTRIAPLSDKMVVPTDEEIWA